MSSFYTSLSGLKAAQTDLSVVSNNIANSNTTGFKKSRAEFGDLVAATAFQTAANAGQGTRLRGMEQQFTQGGFETTDRALDLAVSGQGFFVTHSNATGGTTSFTRAGAFGVDDANNVVDSTGAYLQVLPVDSQGNVTASGLTATKNLNVPQTNGTSQATTTARQAVSLPTSAKAPTAAFDRTNPNSYNYSSSSTVYDASGNPLQATTYYSRTDDGTGNGSTWAARMFVGDSEVVPSGGASPLTMTFDANGAMTAPAAAVAYGAVTPSGASSAIALSVDYAGSAASATTFSASTSQDGFAAGKLNNVSVDEKGLITATYSDGSNVKLGKVAMANFVNPEGLRQTGNATWTITGASGQPTVGTPGDGVAGTVQSGALEQANIDITEELVALIQAQRNFQANAKAIDTANQITDIAVNLRS